MQDPQAPRLARLAPTVSSWTPYRAVAIDLPPATSKAAIRLVGTACPDRIPPRQNPIWQDGLWQLHCDIKLDDPPEFQIEKLILNDPVYRFVQRTWMLQQLPWAALFYCLGGIGFVVWGISARVTVSLIGHWLVGYFAHNSGARDWYLEGHAVQGHHVPFISLPTMGESWHNNHHAFPGSARLGLRVLQFDPGWWVLKTLHAVGLVTNLRLPKDLPERPELVPLTERAKQLPYSFPGTSDFRKGQPNGMP